MIDTQPSESVGPTNARQRVLEASDYGSQIAEDEIGKLSHYFVETEQWRKFYSGECDIVFGAKGSGKSALYSLLTAKKEEFRLGKRTIFLQAENPKGAPAFRDLASITRLKGAKRPLERPLDGGVRPHR